MSNVVVLAGGSPHAHDFAAIGTALADLVRRDGHDAVLVDHPDEAAARLTAGADALVVDALFWRMVGPAYDAWRSEWGYSPSLTTRKAIGGFVHGGGGLVAVHTTPICFDDWPEWGDIVGGAWGWGVSSHPPYGPVTATVVADHPVTAGLGATFDIDDEVYGDMDVRQGVEVLVVAKRSPDDVDQPVVWAHRYGSGRVVFDGFGHDAASICDPANARVLSQALGWVLEVR